jgi:hypothetical protein
MLRLKKIFSEKFGEKIGVFSQTTACKKIIIIALVLL